jgi:hypothetical protein
MSTAVDFVVNGILLHKGGLYTQKEFSGMFQIYHHLYWL